MSYEMFEQGADVYVPAIILSLIVTLLAYGAFPLIFAYARGEKITKKKYSVLCYGINICVMVVFIVIEGKVLSGGAYALWTTVFSFWGVKILRNRGLLEESQPVTSETEAFPKASKKQDTVTPSSVEQKITINFCRKCGNRLISGGAFCNKCGSKINWN